MVVAFPSMKVTEMNGGARMTIAPPVLFRPSQLCVHSFLAGFFDVTDFTIGRHPQFVSSSPIPAVAFHPLAVHEGSMSLDTCNVGMMIKLKVKRNDRKMRICVACRDGGEPPEDWKDVVEPLRRLHYAHPRTVGEVDVPYDFSYEIPDWAIARVSDYEKEVGEELDEPILDDLTFRAWLKGMTIDG